MDGAPAWTPPYKPAPGIPCVVFLFCFVFRTAVSWGFSGLASGSYHHKALYKPILHLIKFNYSIFFILKLNHRHLKEYLFF